MPAAIRAADWIVNSQAQTIRQATRQRTPEGWLTQPTPTMRR